jgi:hypothetical protein
MASMTAWTNRQTEGLTEEQIDKQIELRTYYENTLKVVTYVIIINLTNLS